MMDSMRGLLSGSHDQEDGAIDAPASVGVDERRMQVRAYNYWASLLADRAYPSVEDLDLEGADFGAYSVLLRSEEHTTELQSLMRISYDVFCLKKKTNE